MHYSSQFNFSFIPNVAPPLIQTVTDFQNKTIEAHSYDAQRRGTVSQLANDINGNPIEKVSVCYGTQCYGGSPPINIVSLNDGTGSWTRLYVANYAHRHYIFNTSGTLYACATCGFPGKYNAVITGGYPQVVWDPNGNATAYTYDAQGNMIQRSLPDSNNSAGAGYDTWTYTYNSFGQMLTESDPLASHPCNPQCDPLHTTTYNYDPNGNLLSVTSPKPDANTAASQTVYTYYPNGTLKTVQDPDGNVSTLTYYPTGLINTIKDADLKVTTYVYDGRGNLQSIQDPYNGSTKLTTFTYDAMNRLHTITYPGATVPVTFNYDWRGRRSSVIDQDLNQTTYGYDDADRLVSVTDAQSPTPGVTQYVYDRDNHLTDIYDASHNHTSFTYTNGNYLTSTNFPSGYSENYQPNGIPGLNNTKTDRKNQQIIYSYDAQNRLAKKQYPDNTIVQYTYDGGGRLTQVQDPTGTYTFSYDNMNRLTQAVTAYTFLTTRNFTVQYTYDAASNRKTMTDPESGGYQYTYDALNRLKNLQDFQQLNYAFGYDSLSRRTSLARPNAITSSYAYDSQSRLLSVLHKNSAGTVVDGAAYTYDNAGNRKTRTDRRTSTTLTYGYDNIYQLQTAKQGSTTKESYTYDAVGNRLSSLGVTPYLYNTSNELTSIPGTTYGYDKNGSLTSKTDGTAYTWDYENRLTQVTLPGTGGTVTFKYDPFGRRIQKAFTQGASTTTTNYVYDGLDISANVIEEVDNSGNVLARYTQSPAIDQPLAELRGGTTSYYQQDALSSVTSLSNSAGALANTYTYDSFGKLTASAGTLTNPFQYTGRDLDAETGTNFYRTRFYDSGVGRFTSEDLIRFKGGINFYSYVKNRPVTFTDPIGTCLLQLVTSPNAHAEACGLEPKTNDRCACLCAISPDFEGCMKDCKDGCLSSRLNPVEACQCLCNKGKENGTLNSFEAWLCKQGCKRNLK